VTGTETIPTGWFMVATTAIITIPPTINAMVNLAIARGAKKSASDAAAQQDKILVLADKTHTLVNSQYGIALALIVEKASRIYEISRLEVDRLELEKAKEKLAEHEAKQQTVDSKEAK
jgi:hypothetical protein